MAEKSITQEKVNIAVDMWNFDSLAKKVHEEARTLIDYFRFNLIYYQLVKGGSLEFERIRQYEPGDNIRRIDWKVYARSQDLTTRLYKDECEYDIVIVLDVSNSMLIGTGKMTKIKSAALIAGVLAFAAIEAGDSVALVMHADGQNFCSEPSNVDVMPFLRMLTDHSKYGGRKNWVSLGRKLLSNYQDKSVVFMISDFFDCNPEVLLPELAGKFSKTYGIMVRDPIDINVPSGIGPMYLKDPDTGKIFLIDFDKVRKDYMILSKERVKKISDAFHDYGQLFFDMVTEENFVKAFMKSVGKEEVISY
ncbi:DUF58 domain-containing protein [Candidatus Woesearchaeota archaeon]|nr:DUF58 domain-containing protein [Candidatus Woesearchaeota archaeon]